MSAGQQQGMPPFCAQQLSALIPTERLVLEPLTAAHAELLFLPLQDSRVYRWIPALPPVTLEALSRRWAASEARLSPDGNAAWTAWAVRRSSDGAYVGKMDADVRVDDVATNVGYALFPDFWQQGYATEAMRGLVEHSTGKGYGRREPSSPVAIWLPSGCCSKPDSSARGSFPRATRSVASSTTNWSTSASQLAQKVKTRTITARHPDLL